MGNNSKFVVADSKQATSENYTEPVWCEQFQQSKSLPFKIQYFEAPRYEIWRAVWEKDAAFFTLSEQKELTRWRVLLNKKKVVKGKKVKTGYRDIQFVAPDKKRKTLRLGKVSKRVAEQYKMRVEYLLSSTISGQPIDAETSKWIAALTPTMADRLYRVGMIEKPEEQRCTTLGEFLSGYIEGRQGVKPATKVVWNTNKLNLLEFFGNEKDIRKITPGDADDFKQFLIDLELAPTTIHKRLQFARGFFRQMLRRRLIEEKPFADVSSKGGSSTGRQRFVTREEIEAVLEACPNHHWRTIVALSRFGGLRCPSEVLSLRWDDVQWDKERIIVTSPKTEHHPGKESRVLPLFPELRKHLELAWDLASEGDVYVVDSKYREAANGPHGWKNSNLRTTFNKIVKLAGLSPWPRLFHNLRASRETELVEEYPIHVVTEWIGNTPEIALGHYLMTTEDHFAKAAGKLNPTKKPTQQLQEIGSKELQEDRMNDSKTLDLRDNLGGCENLLDNQAERGGFEPPVPFPRHSISSAAQSATLPPLRRTASLVSKVSR